MPSAMIAEGKEGVTEVDVVKVVDAVTEVDAAMEVDVVMEVAQGGLAAVLDVAARLILTTPVPSHRFK
jgi:hypothetical protein